MRRSAISRRTKRTEVPRRSAACSTDSSVSNSGLLVLRRSCGNGGGGRGGQLLAGDAAVFACPRGGRQGQPPLALGLVAGPDVDPGGDDDHGLVVLGPTPTIQGYPVLGSAAPGEGDPGPA